MTGIWHLPFVIVLLILGLDARIDATYVLVTDLYPFFMIVWRSRSIS